MAVQALREDPPHHVRGLRVGLQPVRAPPSRGMGLVRVRPGVAQPVPVRRPAPDDPDRKERRQAECLVHPYVPWQAIEGVATKTGQARSQVELVLGAVAAQPARVAVRAEWYF